MALIEVVLSASTSAKYLRGDHTWVDLNQAAVAGLTTADSPTFAGLNVPEIANTAGGLKIEPDVQGDVVLFGDTDVADAAAGKSLYLYRMAAEGDSYLRAYVGDDRVVNLFASGAGFALDNVAGTGIGIGNKYANAVSFFDGQAFNRVIYIYGYLTAFGAPAAAYLRVSDDNDEFLLGSAAAAGASMTGIAAKLGDAAGACQFRVRDSALALQFSVDSDGNMMVKGALDHDGATLGLFGTAPVARSTGWTVTLGYTADKAFDPEITSLTEVARVLGTLVDAAKSYGLLGA